MVFGERMSLVLVFMLAVSAPAWAADDAGKSVVMHGGSDGATPCVACHGADGAGMAAVGYPRLAGLTAAYIKRQLQAYRNGSRDNAIMKPVAIALTEQEIDDVARYYADRDAPVEGTEADASLLAKGRYLARHGDWANETPGCVQCHGDRGQGVGGAYFPSLAGQHASYITNQIKAWQSGQRHNDPVGLMAAVAESLDDDQIRAVAAWFANLPTADKTAVDKATQALADQGFFDTASGDEEAFTPPGTFDIPDDEYGRMVRLGRQVFVNTQKHASQYVGNGLNCKNCHMNAGRLADAAPLWGAWGNYPAYRGKNDKVNTMIDRMQGCFMFSMNGKAPPADSKVMVALLAYTHWMSHGAPTGVSLPGRGYPALSEPDKKPSPKRGAEVYQADCAVCHGNDGQGKRIDGDYIFPPLWGPDSYNWGAGMHRLNTAAAFIHANMPLGRGGQVLSEQEAWDVAAFVDHHPRPQDPRFAGDMQKLAAQHHDHMCYYNSFDDSIAAHAD